MSGAPLISVIVAVYNGAATLQQCLDSVAAQTWPHKELIVVDGGSKDGTAELLRDNEDKIAWWVSEPDRGIYNAWNKGLRQAKGEWVCFLGADDCFRDARVLERMAEKLRALPPDIRVAYGQVMLVDAAGHDRRLLGEPWPALKARFRQLMCIPHPGLMHRRSLFESHGGFDESFRIAGDYELLLRELRDGDAAFVSGLVTVSMREGGISNDPANGARIMREIRRAQRMHGLRWPGWTWLSSMARVYVRLMLWRLKGGQR